MNAPSRERVLASLLILPTAFVAACGGSEEPTEEFSPTDTIPATPAPTRVEVPEPARPLRGVMDNEALSEVVDNWLQALGNKVRIRDFDGIAQAFSDDLRAEPLFPQRGAGAPEDGTIESLPLGVERLLPTEPNVVLGRDEFLAQIEDTIGPWARLSQSRWRLSNAKFRPASGGSGLVDYAYAHVKVHIVGHDAVGGTTVLNAKLTCGLHNVGGSDWRITHLRAEERQILRHGDSMFSEVSRAAHVAYDGLRFGEPGNDSDGWNGVAGADVDGDGLVDIFVPGARRGFLYKNRGDGLFDEVAEESGLEGTAGGTGAVFFDYDRDGDQDLAVAFIGWMTLAHEPAGRSLTLFENDGKGVFTDVSVETGMADHRLAAYTLTAFDANGDGWTDLFACGYGRMDFEINDSWIEASNGAPDLLLRNEGGESFVDVTIASGLDDRRWSYASAAADYDEDGDLDLFIGNNFGTSRLWRNRGDGTFEDVAEELGVAVQGNVMGVVWTDLNSDGALDLYLASPTSTSGSRILEGVEREWGRGSSGSMMQMANGNKAFRSTVNEEGVRTFVPMDIGGTRGGWAWSVASPDVDLDGTRDVVCVNGFVTGELTGDT